MGQTSGDTTVFNQRSLWFKQMGTLRTRLGGASQAADFVLANANGKKRAIPISPSFARHQGPRARSHAGFKLSVGFGIESDIFGQSERSNPIPKESAPGTVWKLSSSRPITARYIKRTSPSDTEFNVSAVQGVQVGYLRYLWSLNFSCFWASR